jgi:hypothetical protein
VFVNTIAIFPFRCSDEAKNAAINELGAEAGEWGWYNEAIPRQIGENIPH